MFSSTKPTMIVIFVMLCLSVKTFSPSVGITSVMAQEENLFEYDANAPLIIKEIASSIENGVTIRDITYLSPVDSTEIAAYMVLPEGEGPFPALLYVHWYEPNTEDSNREQFLDEATQFAQEGVASILVETMWSRPNWYRSGRSLATDYNDVIRQTIELRRAIDVLVDQAPVDTNRIGYVGHDFGAMYGAILASVDARPNVYVLISGASNFNEWMLFGVPDDQTGLADYMAQMDALAPANFIKASSPSAVLFQYGTQDGYTPGNDVFAFFNAAPEPKFIELYASGHAMRLPEIRENRLTFLRTHLNVGS